MGTDFQVLVNCPLTGYRTGSLPLPSSHVHPHGAIPCSVPDPQHSSRLLVVAGMSPGR